MPTTYAHDAFGRKVLDQLPEKMQEKIREHIQLFRIGLHGPDILFYYGLNKNYVNQTGVRLHGEIAYPFFEKGLNRAREEQDEALLVYLLGFACHYMLDSTCHPYIYHIEDQVSHTVIEKEMDRRLMQRDGRNALTYFPAKGIHPSMENARVIQKVLSEISVEDIVKTLKGMRRYTGMMVYGDGKRRKILMPLLGLAGQEKTLGEHLMTKDADTNCTVYLDVLDELYQRALEDTPSILELVYRCGVAQEDCSQEDRLPERFRRTYEG